MRRPGPRSHYHNHRRGMALIEALLAGLILSIGLGAMLSIVSRSINAQRIGEQQIVAAALLDELLSTVLMEGPENFSRRHPVDGRFDPPFQEYSFLIELNPQGQNVPFQVIATVSWDYGGAERSYSIETLIAERRGEEEIIRQPEEPIYR